LPPADATLALARFSSRRFCAIAAIMTPPDIAATLFIYVIDIFAIDYAATPCHYFRYWLPCR
jgi:hypothetical protein